MKVRPIIASLCVTSILATTVGARAADGNCQPIASTEIDRQWEYYKSLSGVHDTAGGDQYQCIVIDSTKAIVCRTTPANPAHSSIVIRTIIEDNGNIAIRTEADTAADCGKFLEMMAQFQELNQKMRENMQNSAKSGSQ